MKTIHEFVSTISGMNVKMWFEGDRLRCRAPRGVITPALLDEIRERKAEIYSFLHKDGIPPIEPVLEQEYYDLSHAQRRLWILDRFEGMAAAYSMPGAVALDGALDVNACENCFTELVRRHDSLRTVFRTVDGEPKQKVFDFQSWISDREIMRRVDLTGKANPEKRAREIAREDARKPFDLGNGPLLRVSLLTLSDKKHVMLFNTHHIISDGWSMSLLVREFCRLYEYFNTQSARPGAPLPCPLAPLPIQYKDYAAWQNRLLSGKMISLHRDYWLETFSGEITPLALPTDFPRPGVQTFNGDAVTLDISSGRLEKLKALGGKMKVSLFMSLLAMVKVLLHRHTGREDVIVGSPIAGRNHLNLEGQIGFYVNTLALRSRVDGDDAFIDFLEKVKQTTQKAYDHQIYPFDSLVEELNLRRDPSRSPLFDVMVALQNNEDENLSLEGLRIQPFGRKPPVSKYDLTFNFMEKHDGLRMEIEYNTDLFLKDRIERMGAHFSELLKSSIENPHTAVDSLNILPKAELHKVLYEFNKTDSDYPRDRTVVDLFEERVEKWPDAAAVVFGDNRLTFRQLNERANRVAHFLTDEYGIEPDDRIAVLLERSESSVIGMLSVLKTGGAYLPVDPAYPEERIRFIIKDGGCKAVLTEKAFFELADAFTPLSFVDIRAVEHEKSGNPLVPVSFRNLSYVIYTSGSTGRPKGVMQTHGCLSNLLQWQMSETGTEWRILQYAATGFDVSMQETLYSLVSGSELHVIPRELRYDMAPLAAFIKDQRIDMFTMPFSALKLLFQEPAVQDNESIRHIITSGETLRIFPELRRYLKTHPGVRLHNQYGPTETHVATSWTATGASESLPDRPPIGKPVSNTRIVILDGRENTAPEGVYGEIHVGGAHLARGYLNNEELTGRKFIPDPFREGARLYRTGDMGRWLLDGNIEFKGRNDDQMKIRGHRVELGEIENRLLRHEAVTEAVVIPVGAPGEGDRELAAYLTGHEELNSKTLRDHIKKALPDYMIPAYFIQIEKIPLTPNGKTDKKALPNPIDAKMATGVEYIAPRNEAEQKLASIWEEVLHAADMGVHDNFFELGGHSLKAAWVIARVNKSFGVDVSLSSLFQYQTLADLAGHIEAVRRVGLGPEEIGGLGEMEEREEGVI